MQETECGTRMEKVVRQDKKILIADVHDALRDDALRAETRDAFKRRLNKLHTELYTYNYNIVEYYRNV